ncbi:MAG: hypothetical protein ISP45_07345, partial [Reyranella sp.]|nr:hypothetical protein [Reyranella sp.]
MHGSIEARDAADVPVDVDAAMRRAAAPSARGGRDDDLLFFCPDVTDASTLKRVQQF